MITGTVSGLGAFDEILSRINAVKNLDLAPLAAQIAAIIAEDNASGLQAGTDADGNAMAPLAASTLRHRAGSGPPGVPTSASSLINGFATSVEIGSAGLTIRAGYVNGQVATYFSAGTSRQPARPLQGVRPGTWRRIEQALSDFARVASAGY